MSEGRFSLGCGSASSLDPVDMAKDLADTGLVDTICFDALSERTLTLAQLRKLGDSSLGYDVRLAEIIQKLAEFIRKGGTVIGNFGAANPDAGAAVVLEQLRSAGLQGKRVGLIRGDDVREIVLAMNPVLYEIGTHVQDVADRVLCANAYIGAEPIVSLLQEQVDVVVGGRLSDPSMYVGAICHRLGWKLDDWDRVSAATLAGHLLETGTYTTGGVFSDPPYRSVPDAHRLGMPFAYVDEDEVVITKAPNTGGMVSCETVKAMLGYEIHDPGAYKTPDVVADFLDVEVEQIKPDEVRAVGAKGNPAPETFKVLVGLDRGWKGVGEVSFGGPGCLERAEEAVAIVKRRLDPFRSGIEDERYDLIGHSSLLGDQFPKNAYPREIRLRVSVRSLDYEVADRAAKEAEYLLLVGPAGAGGGTTQVTRALGVTPCLIGREEITLETEVQVA